jgi:hypothetical protein
MPTRPESVSPESSRNPRGREDFQSFLTVSKLHRGFEFSNTFGPWMCRMSDPGVDGRPALRIRFRLAQNFSGHGGNVTLAAQNVVEEV